MAVQLGPEKLELVAMAMMAAKDIDEQLPDTTFEIITPKERACQLSVFLHGQGRKLFDYLMSHGVVTDWREPNVIRLAPAPLYCTFEDMYQFGQILKKGIEKLAVDPAITTSQ